MISTASACVPWFRYVAFGTPQQILHAPEAAAGQYRAFQSLHFVAHLASST
jgi:hypothetical protein